MPIVEVFEASEPPKGGRTDADLDFRRQELAAGLKWLQSHGVETRHYTIPTNGSVAIENATVKTALELQGPEALPMLAVDGTIISVGGYPTRAELSAAAGFPAMQDLEFFQEVLGLVAGMSAALVGNDLEQCLSFYQKARGLGVSEDNLRKALDAAKAGGRKSVRDETLTRLDQFLAFGPSGKPPKQRCACGNNV